MAITISSQPLSNRVLSAYRELKYVVTSNAATIAKCQAEIYVLGTLVKTVVLDPDISTTNQFTFDLHNFVADTLTYDLQNPGFTLAQYVDCPTNSIKSVYVIFNEVLLSGGVYTVQSTDYTSNTSYLINAVQQPLEVSFTAISTDNSSKPFLTNAPDNQIVERGQVVRLGYILFSTSNYVGKIYQYNGATLLGTTTSSTQTVTLKRGYVLIDTQFLSGLCDSFVFQLEDTLGNAISEQRTYNVKQAICEDNQRIWFMNQYGDFDQFTFTGEYVEGMEVSSKEFKKYFNLSTFIGRGLQQANSDIVLKFAVSSRALNREEKRWLKELYYSPEVYLYDQTSQLVPIIIVNKDKWNINSNDLGNGLKVEYIYANHYISQ